MSKFKNFAVSLLAIAVMFNFLICSFCKTYDVGNLSEIYSMQDEESFACNAVVIRPIDFTEGDDLGRTDWSSLAEAKAYY